MAALARSMCGGVGCEVGSLPYFWLNALEGFVPGIQNCILALAVCGSIGYTLVERRICTEWTGYRLDGKTGYGLTCDYRQVFYSFCGWSDRLVKAVFKVEVIGGQIGLGNNNGAYR